LSLREQQDFLLKEGDLLFARQSLTYEGAGKCSIVLPADRPRTWESHLMRARLNPFLADSRFYYYFFRSPQGRRLVESLIQQVAAAGIRGSDLRRLKVPFPSFAEQSAVGDVLYALDDKIAANARLASAAE